MTTSPAPTWEHNGFTITLDPARGRFSFRLPNEENAKWTDSLAEAQEAIDAHLKAAASELKVSLEFLLESGERCTVTGVNRSTHNVLGVPKSEGSRYIYVPSALVEGLLEQRRALSAGLEATNKALEAYRVSQSRGYGNLPPEKYPIVVNRLVQEYAEKKAAAEAAEA